MYIYMYVCAYVNNNNNNNNSTDASKKEVHGQCGSRAGCCDSCCFDSGQTEVLDRSCHFRHNTGCNTMRVWLFSCLKTRLIHDK